MRKLSLIVNISYIVAEETTQDGNDSQQLSPMLEKAQEILGVETLTGLADSGYYSHQQIKACEDENISVYVPIPNYPAPAKIPGLLVVTKFNIMVKTLIGIRSVGAPCARLNCFKIND
ncbi:MAG: transposase [Gammaproteobacteria bacterium]